MASVILIIQSGVLNSSDSQQPSTLPTPLPSNGSSGLGSTQTEQLSVTAAYFATKYVRLTTNNTGAEDITIVKVNVNGETYSTTSSTVKANSQGTLLLQFPVLVNLEYRFELFTANGNSFTYSATAKP